MAGFNYLTFATVSSPASALGQVSSPHFVPNSPLGNRDKNSSAGECCKHSLLQSFVSLPRRWKVLLALFFSSMACKLLFQAGISGMRICCKGGGWWQSSKLLQTGTISGFARDNFDSIHCIISSFAWSKHLNKLVFISFLQD